MVRGVAGMLGIVALFVAMVVGSFAAFGDIATKAPQGAPAPAGDVETNAEATTNQLAEQAAAIGETVNAGDVSWTVTDAKEETEVRSFTFPPEEIPGDYVSVDFTVENVSEEPVTLTSEEVTLYDASEIEFRPEPDRNSTFVRPELAILFNEHSRLEPGEKREGKLNVEVQPGSEGFVIRLGDTDPTVSEGEYVDLGF